MYKREFDGLLRQEKRFNAYLFYGQSPYLIEHYAFLVASSIAQSDEMEKFYYDEYDFKSIHTKLLQSSLFTSNNLIMIKTEKKIPKKEIDALVDACVTNPDSTMILSCMGDADFKQIEKSFSKDKNAVSVRFFIPSVSEAMTIIDSEAKKLKLDYEMTALNHLYNMHRQDLALTCNDLKKLSIVEGRITTNIVDHHCFGFGNVNIEEFLFKLFSCENIDRDLNDILNEGVNEVYLVGQITSFLQQLFMIASYARIHGHANAKEILGFVPPKHIWDKRARLAISIKLEEYSKMMDFLNECELGLKSETKLDQNAYLQASLRKFSINFR